MDLDVGAVGVPTSSSDASLGSLFQSRLKVTVLFRCLVFSHMSHNLLFCLTFCQTFCLLFHLLDCGEGEQDRELLVQGCVLLPSGQAFEIKRRRSPEEPSRCVTGGIHQGDVTWFKMVGSNHLLGTQQIRCFYSIPVLQGFSGNIRGVFTK